MKDRIIYIDIAKTICIILVVFGHYIPNNSPEWWIMVHDIIYSFHMPLFMFASGFVYIATRKEQQSYLNFIVKKIRRLMVPYFVVSFLIISIKLLTESHLYVENPKTIMSYIKMFYYPEAGYFLWFIWALWWMFIIVPLFKSKNKRLILFITSIFFAYIPINVTDILCIAQFKRMFMYFMLGVVVFEWRNLFSYCRRIPTFGYLSLFTFSFILNKLKGNLYNIDTFTALTGIASVILLSRYIDKKNWNTKWILTISQSSFIIYLFHTTFQGFAKAVIFKIPYLNNINNDIRFTIGAIIVITSGIVIPILLNEFILKKYKITRILFGLK